MLHKLHRTSACIIGTFVVAHISNHLAAVQSVEAHVAFMEVLRQFYRLRFVEFVLLGCVALQAGSGILLIKRRHGQRRGFFEYVQSASGGYLAFFLLIHVGAVLVGRAVLKLDTNFYFAAAGMHVTPFQLYYLPYYFLAVAAVFGHVACAVHWLSRNHFGSVTRDRLGYAVIILGLLASLIVVTAFAGGLYPVEIPIEYKATYGV